MFMLVDKKTSQVRCMASAKVNLSVIPDTTLVELDADKVEGTSLDLYDIKTKTWTIITDKYSDFEMLKPEPLDRSKISKDTRDDYKDAQSDSERLAILESIIFGNKE